MRRIIFRALSECKGEHWVFGNLRHYARNPHTEKWTIHDPETGLETDIDERTICEFTGLKDKNGTDIYEGDILRVKEFENLLFKEFSDDPNRFDLFTLEEIRGELRKEYISPVIFDEGGFQISTCGDYYDMWLASLYGDMKHSSPSFDFEVIGNIYDNPDLK